MNRLVALFKPRSMVETGGMPHKAADNNNPSFGEAFWMLHKLCRHVFLGRLMMVVQHCFGPLAGYLALRTNCAPCPSAHLLDNKVVYYRHCGAGCRLYQLVKFLLLQ